jgi:hypothetical protein
MRRTFHPFRLLLISVAGWLGQQQRDVIDCQIAPQSARFVQRSDLPGIERP